MPLKVKDNRLGTFLLGCFFPTALPPPVIRGINHTVQGWGCWTWTCPGKAGSFHPLQISVYTVLLSRHPAGGCAPVCACACMLAAISAAKLAEHIVFPFFAGKQLRDTGHSAPKGNWRRGYALG